MNNQERRLMDAKTGAAIENACAKLPEGYTINVVLTTGGGDVALWDEDGEECEFPSNCETLAETLDDAVEFAIQDAAKQSAT